MKCINNYVRYSTLSNLPFGELYYPRSNKEKLIHLQIIDKIPYNMMESWLERNDILLRSKLKHVPQQFAEASLKYSDNNHTDYLLLSLLRFCIQTKQLANLASDNVAIANKKGCLNNIVDKIEEHFDCLNSAECGIILRCLTKLEYKNDLLYRRLVYRIAERGQIFSIHASLSALNYIINGKCDDKQVLFDLITTLIFHNKDKMDLDSTAILINLLSKSNFDVNKCLNELATLVLDLFEIERTAGSSLDKNRWNESVIHMILNGLSRKNVLNKKIFDNFEFYVIRNCADYSIDTIVSLCNAYSKFGNVNDSKYLNLYDKLANQIILRKNKLNTRHICVIANAFAKVFICHDHLFSILDDVLLLQIGSFTPRQLSMIIHAFSKVQYNSRNNMILWDRCIQSIDSFCWQSLTMLFQSYTKGGYMDDSISNLFCQRFYELFGSTMESEADLPQSITLVSLVYSLAKSGILHHVDLLLHIVTATAKFIRNYNGDEIANLAYSFTKIYAKYNDINDTKDVKSSQLVQQSYDILLDISKYIDEVKLPVTPFSMLKIIQSFGDCRFTPALPTIVNMIIRNILTLDKISYSHINIMINCLSNIGVHNHDILTILNNIKYNKKHKQTIQ